MLGHHPTPKQDRSGSYRGMNPTNSPKRFLRVGELAELLAVRPSWIYDRTGQFGPEFIPHLKLGRQLRFDIESEAFQSWIRKHAVDASRVGRPLDSQAS